MWTLSTCPQRAAKLKISGGLADHSCVISASRAHPLPWINLWDVPNAVRSRNHVLARIPRGTPVEILEWQGEGWARVRVESPAGPLYGWVHGSFLSRTG